MFQHGKLFNYFDDYYMIFVINCEDWFFKREIFINDYEIINTATDCYFTGKFYLIKKRVKNG